MIEKDIQNLKELEAFAAKNTIVMVEFFATWCGPCFAIAPYVQKRCSEEHVALAKVDVDIVEDVAAKYNITGLPTLIVIDSKCNELNKITGGSQTNVDKLIEFIFSHK